MYVRRRNFWKLASLVIDEGGEALRHRFLDGYKQWKHSSWQSTPSCGAQFYQDCQYTGYWFPEQIAHIQSGDVSSWDLTILGRILGSRPLKGLNIVDLVQDNIKVLIKIRNKHMQHRPSCSIPESEFQGLFQGAKQALLGLGCSQDVIDNRIAGDFSFFLSLLCGNSCV